MKHIINLCLCASVFNLSAALPEDWEVDLAAQPPKVFTLQRPRGETYDLKAVLKRHGKPFEPAITNACIYWQTNGMENLYWSAPASVSNNVLRATWLPSMDPGATTVRGYIGDPGHIYAAAFQFRFIASPGALPNELPLPQKVIDFAKVTVLNPPWSGGGGGGVNTNAVRDIVRDTLATNGIRAVDGAARPLPKYLHLYETDDSYPDAAAEYYRSRGDGRTDGGCSSVRDGGFLYRNFDYPFDDRAEFVVKMSAGKDRFASVGVSQVGTNLTEQMVTSGKWSKWYKALPGATVDGINENGVACNINVVGGDPQTSGWHTTGDLNPLAAIRWILDHATNAQSAAEFIAANIRFPQGWSQNFHYMVCDADSTYTVEDGFALDLDWTQTPFPPVMTNFRYFYFRPDSTGVERYQILSAHVSITNAWYTNAYRRETNPPWVSDLVDVIDYTNEIFDAWASHPKEYFRNSSLIPYPSSLTWWQTVHTSVYDISNRVLRVAVQETDDWYTFQVPASGGSKIDAYTKDETDAKLSEKMPLHVGDSAVTVSIGDLGSVRFSMPSGIGPSWVFDTYGLNGRMDATGIRANITLDDGDISTGAGEISAHDLARGFTHKLTDKADRAGYGDDGELATLDADGNPTRSGKRPSDFLGTTNGNEYPSKIYWDGDVLVIETLNGNRAFSIDMSDTSSPRIRFEYSEGFGWLEDSVGNTVQDIIGDKADRSMISATNATFSNEVAEVAKTVTPTPTGTLRLFDTVLNRWVILKSVNMNLTLEVE